jgi:tetratricopeptide (TPR) repeat protein
MNRKCYNLAVFSAFVAFLALSTNTALAKSVTFQREYTYQASEADSKLTCRAIVLEQIKRLLLEELGTYLEAQTEVKNYQLSKDQITTLTAGIVQTEIVDEKWDGREYQLKAKITADPAQVAKSLDDLRKDHQKTKELEELRKKAEQASKEIERLKSELTSLKGKSDTKKLQQYNQAVNKLSALDWAERAYALASSGDCDGAIEASNMAIRLDPYNSTYYDNRAFCYGIKGQLTKALADLNKAIELDPRNDHAYENRGYGYSSMGQHEKALADLNKAIEINPDNSRAYAHLGDLYGNKLGNYAKGLEYYDKAIKLNPLDDYSYLMRAFLHSNNRKYNEAISDAGKAIELDPQDFDNYYFRAYVYKEIDLYDKAIADYSKSIELTSSTVPPSRVAKLYYGRGMCYIFKCTVPNWGDAGKPFPSMALADLNRSIELDPSNAEAYHFRGTAYWLLNKNDLMIENYRIAARMGSEAAQRTLREKGMQW